MGTDTDRRFRILLVDDNPAFLSMMTALLECADDRFAIETETSGRAALDRLADDPVDCVVADYDIPDMTGLELRAAVREAHPGVGFILMADHDPMRVDAEPSTAGVDAYYRKTAAIERYSELTRRIRSLVETAPAERRGHAPVTERPR